MTHKYASTLVVKYGGGAMPLNRPAENDPILAEIASLRRAGSQVVLVHGGGPEIDAALALRGIETARIDGLRVTDLASLEVTEAVLCGSINKRIVRDALGLGLPAVGVSGQDGNMLVAERALGKGGANLGYVGTIVATDARPIRALLDAGFLPVVAPLAVARDASHALNVNADSAAAAIAAELGADAFVAVTNVRRVLRDPDDPASGIDRFTADEAFAFAAGDACRSSMKPKVTAAAGAVKRGAAAAYICAFKTNAIASALAGDATIVCALA
ncbi:MAG TPA: acetylglutamate kinase [Candidatus Babeliales bacterium]|nr:acetylglutamate kinase [Candidatus Babeliales bacterium]